MPNRYARRPDGTISTIIVDAVVTFNYDINANAVDTSIFIADAPYEVVKVQAVPRVAGSDGGAVTAAVMKCTGTQAPASGTAVHSGTINLKGTADTVLTPTMSTTKATRELASGDRLAVDFTGTLTAAVGLIQVYLKRIQAAGSDK